MGRPHVAGPAVQGRARARGARTVAGRGVTPSPPSPTAYSPGASSPAGACTSREPGRTESAPRAEPGSPPPGTPPMNRLNSRALIRAAPRTCTGRRRVGGAAARVWPAADPTPPSHRARGGLRRPRASWSAAATASVSLEVLRRARRGGWRYGDRAAGGRVPVLWSAATAQSVHGRRWRLDGGGRAWARMRSRSARRTRTRRPTRTAGSVWSIQFLSV